MSPKSFKIGYSWERPARSSNGDRPTLASVANCYCRLARIRVVLPLGLPSQRSTQPLMSQVRLEKSAVGHSTCR